MPKEEPEETEQPTPGHIWTCSDRRCGQTNAAVSTTCWGCGKGRQT